MSATVQNTVPETFECPVCQLALGADGSVDTEVTTTTCGHEFGNDCLARWLTTANTCPMCRTDLGPPRLPQVGAEDLGELELVYLVDQILELHRHVVSAWVYQMGMAEMAPNVLDYDSANQWGTDFLAFLRTWQSPHNDELFLVRMTLESGLARDVDWLGRDGDRHDLQLLNDFVLHLRYHLPAGNPENNFVNDPYHEQILRLHSLVASVGYYLLDHDTERQLLDAPTLHRMRSVTHCAVYAIESAEMDAEGSVMREFRVHLAVHEFSVGVLDMSWPILVRFLLGELQPMVLD